MTKQTVFYPRLRDQTDQWMELFGYSAPLVITGAEEEYAAIRETAGLMEFSMLRKLDIEGSEALHIVNSTVTRDVSKLELGHGAYTALTEENGKMVDDGTVFLRARDRVRWCGASDRAIEIFREQVAGTAVTVREVTEELAHPCVQGPKAREILQPLANADLSNGAFPYYSFREDIEIAGIPVFMPRLGYTAELGYELWVERDRALELWDALIDAGKSHGMRIAGIIAIVLARVEGGFILPGAEYDTASSPYECGLGWAVDLGKGDFRGRSALARDSEETTLRLTSVEFTSAADWATGAPIFVGDKEVGIVTAAVASPYREGKTVGLARIRKDLNQPGTTIEVRLDERRAEGHVVRHPVYDPQRIRVKS